MKNASALEEVEVVVPFGVSAGEELIVTTHGAELLVAEAPFSAPSSEHLRSRAV